VPAVVSGFVHDILNNEVGKILNGVDFPMWNAPIVQNSYATDIAAWDFTLGKHNTTHDTAYPTKDMRWGLAGTSDTLTFMHIDSDGFNTFLYVACGMKLLGIYHERPNVPLSSTNVYVDKSFKLDWIEPNASYDLEAVVLRQGDFL
jgi:hypothetical protein